MAPPLLVSCSHHLDFWKPPVRFCSSHSPQSRVAGDRQWKNKLFQSVQTRYGLKYNHTICQGLIPWANSSLRKWRITNRTRLCLSLQPFPALLYLYLCILSSVYCSAELVTNQWTDRRTRVCLYLIKKMSTHSTLMAGVQDLMWQFYLSTSIDKCCNVEVPDHWHE